MLLADDRSVGADFFIQNLVAGSDEAPPNPFDDFVGLAGALVGEADGDPVGWGADAFAGQNSSVSSSALSGSLEARASIDDPDRLLDVFGDMGDSESHFAIRFDLLTAHSFLLSGDFSVDAAGTAGQAATLTLGSIRLSESDSPFAIVGILPPGSYDPSVEAAVFVFPNERGHVLASFDLQLSEVPEPATVWLLSAALIGGVGASRR